MNVVIEEIMRQDKVIMGNRKRIPILPELPVESRSLTPNNA